MKKIVNICDVCNEIFAGGDAPKDRFSKTKTEKYQIPIYSNGEANNGLYGYTDFFRVNVPSITVSARGTIGYTSIREEPFVPIVRLITLIPNLEMINIRYLYYAIQNYNFADTGTSIPQLTVPTLKKYSFPLPEIKIQELIVERLDVISKIIENRKKQVQQLDELLNSRFIELFGEPFLNPKMWSVGKIGDIVTEVRYGTSRPAVDGGKYPYLRMNNLTFDGHLDLNDLKYIDIPDSEIEKCIVRKGDVLFNRTNSVELVGKTCVFDLDDDMVIAGYIIRVRLNEKALPVFLSAYMNSPILKEHLRGMAKGAVNQANINAQELQGIQIYLPPIELQQQFAEFVEQVEKAKQVIKEQLEQLEILKKSLMQKYFG